MSKALIRLENVTKIYEPGGMKVHALRDIYLEIRRGEYAAVIGKSGSGKSTLLNMITGIDLPSYGNIHIAGEKINALKENRRALLRGKHIGIVFQFFQLIPTLTILDNILLPMDLLNELPMRERARRGEELLARVGIADQGNKLPSQLSGGQQQRAAIARALANDPALLIADEPTGNLDSRTSEMIFSLFEELVNQGKTILIVTHEKEIGEKVSRLIELKDGEKIIDTVTSSNGKERLYV